MTDPSTSSTVLITGASTGIGRELAKIFAHHGHNLLLVARSEPHLTQLAAELRTQHRIAVHTILHDLSTPGSPDRLFQEIQHRSLSIDILVNNAGVALQGPFAQSDLSAQLALLQLNIVSLTHLTRLLLPPMLQRRRGRILNVASIAAYLPGPLTATYNASKAYVLSFSEALSNELRGTGITVTALCPGPTNTHFAARAGLTHTKAFRGKTMDAAAVARIGYHALMQGRRVVVPGLLNKLRLLPLRLIPRCILAHFSRQYHTAPQSPSPVQEGRSAGC